MDTRSSEHMIINCRVIRKGRTEQISRGEQKQDKGDKKIRVRT